MSWGLSWAPEGGTGTHVSEIQGGINLVHDIQRRRLVMMQRKHERKTAQRLLATG